MTEPDEITIEEAREFARAVLRVFPRSHRLQATTTKTTNGEPA